MNNLNDILTELKEIKDMVDDLTDAYVDLNSEGLYNCDETVAVDIQGIIDDLEKIIG